LFNEEYIFFRVTLFEQLSPKIEMAFKEDLQYTGELIEMTTIPV